MTGFQEQSDSLDASCIPLYEAYPGRHGTGNTLLLFAPMVNLYYNAGLLHSIISIVRGVRVRSNGFSRQKDR
jgi:hypothetical protein